MPGINVPPSYGLHNRHGLRTRLTSTMSSPSADQGGLRAVETASADVVLTAMRA